MRWLTLNLTRRVLLCLLLMLSLTACSHPSGNHYFCPPTITFDENGLVQPETYAVNRACYKSMTEKLAACYKDAE